MAGKYKKARLSFSKTTSTSAEKKPRVKFRLKSARRLSKTKIDERMHIARFSAVGFLILASFSLLTGVSMVWSGGWDSSVVLLISFAPLLSLAALGLTWLIKTKYQRRARDYRLCLVFFVLCSGVFFTITGYFSILHIRSYFAVDYIPKLVGAYNCADSEKNRELGIYTTRFLLATKHFQIEEFRSDAHAYGSYEAKAVDDKYVLSMLIKKNTEKDKSYKFDETKYELQFESDTNVRLTLGGSSIVRFCTKQ